MSVDFDRIYGNERLKSHFSYAIESGTLPHAVILEGAKGSGKYTFAINIAAAASCEASHSPCGVCDRCRKIYKFISPDVMTYDLPEGRAAIPVDTVREIKSGATSVPVEGDYKFYIMRNSEKLTVQAQNALLKVLEEPKSFVIFILLCTSSSLLLPTIVSRAQVFSMQRFSQDEMESYFYERVDVARKLASNDPQGFAYIIRSASGSIGAALENMNKRSFSRSSEKYERREAFFEALLSSDKSVFMAFEDDFNTKSREEFNGSISDIRLALRDILSAKSTSEPKILYFASSEKPQAFSVSLTLESIVDMIALCNQTLSDNELNANLNLLKINFMNGLWRNAHS